jgi:hypothetical protein
LDTAKTKSFAMPDEVREFPKGRLEIIQIGGVTVRRGIFDPGWRWSTSVQPLVRTQNCGVPHFTYHVAGVLKIVMDDGSEFVCRPGDACCLSAWHDAWVVGDEPVIVVDFQGLAGGEKHS